jgi:hypothetical protein
MTVTLWADSPCLLCGYRIRVLMVATVRVNRRSMRTTGPGLGGFQYVRCPECGTDNRTGIAVAPRSPYRLVGEDARRVAEYRHRRWGITGGPGVAVERVA